MTTQTSRPETNAAAELRELIAFVRSLSPEDLAGALAIVGRHASESRRNRGASRPTRRRPLVVHTR